MVKTIGVDTQKESWAEGFEIFDEDEFFEKEFGNFSNKENKLGKNIILHKGKDDKIKNLLTFIQKRGIVDFKNGGFIVKLFLKEDDLWQDALQKHLHSKDIRVANGRGFSEAYNKKEGNSENDHIDFFIPPNTILFSIGRGCLDYNKVSHFHTVLIERGLTVKKIVEWLKMKRVCVFKENILNKNIEHNDDSDKNDQSEYVLIQIEKDSINVKIYRENDKFNGCKPNERFILQKINPIWTDYVVFIYMKNGEFIGYPFLVYWNSTEVIETFERTRSEVFYTNNSFLRNTQVVTWNMIKLKYNIIDKIYLIQNDTMRQMDGDEEVQTGSICVLLGG
ncbi:hypothetical protein M153_5403000196 [Pseudoloma neurophilia]|uniref:Uncharacterized protein n=1 Tax=Pseudoloma neurophilia TaxID=146866 RepID=A0A0R0LT53_9MICR|nr:hypothetical protein M153_5403000196 [Pseudoloma neurophilia]